MTEILPGQLAYIFGVSILDAALLSWLALIWYRRSVRRLMRAGAPVRSTAPANGHPLAPSSTDGQADTGAAFPLAEESPRPDAAGPLLRSVGQRRVVLAYALGAAAYAAIVTTLKLRGESLPAAAWLVEWWTNAWPIVPTLAVLLVLDRRATRRLALMYLTGGAAAIALFTLAGQLARGTVTGAPLTNVFWALVSLAWTASIPLALVALMSWRRVRAVMPLAIAATLVFGFGSIAARELLVRTLNVGALRSAVLTGAIFSSAQVVQYALFMMVSLPVGWMAWRLLKRLGSAFARKRFSDVQLVIDCWWAMIAAEVTATALSIQYGFAGIAGGVAAFLAYRVCVAAVLHRAQSADVHPRRLLLLRVFGYQRRTETLFDRIAQAWRFHGPVQLIAGVDLAMRTADPGDLLALLNRRLASLYVASPVDVASRIGHLDVAPDPDGRFRVNEMYCHNDTWRLALEALLDASETVLMDVRAFSAQNAGIIFELEQLVRRLGRADVVLVCDRTTDLPLLRRVLGEALAAAPRHDRAVDTPAMSLVRVERHSASELGTVMQRLIAGPRSADAAM